MHDDNLRMMSLILLASLLFAVIASGAPNGATIISNSTETPAAAPAGAITTAGGSFTTLLLNTTGQNPRWKAYVGNITGQLSLDDSSGQSIYDWTLSVITGEIYASRNNSITWSNIACANRTTIVNEENFLNITTSREDSINSTFNDTVHQEFFVGNVQISSSSCPAIATYVNNSRQSTSENADFQEILLQDSDKLVYTTILEQDSQGYAENNTYDFQMIVAEDEFRQTPTTYYFYAEIG